MKKISGYVRKKKGRDFYDIGYCFVWTEWPPEISDPENYDIIQVEVVVKRPRKARKK